MADLGLVSVYFLAEKNPRMVKPQPEYGVLT